MSGTTSPIGSASLSLAETSIGAGSGLHRRARIDRDALSANLAGLDDAYLDARADAFGHSLSLVGAVARDHGFTRVLVTDESDGSLARSLGFTDVVVGRREPAEPVIRDVAYGVANGSRAVMTLTGEVIAVKHIEAGAGVSYGYTFRTETATTLALVGLGYADGVPRLASNRAEAQLAGARRPLVGRIAMDQLVLNCGNDSPVAGDDAVLFGDPAQGYPSLADWAAWTERSPLDITAGLGHRIRRETA